MQQAILEAWIPLIIALIISFVLLRLCTAIIGARWMPTRFASLYHCEQGSVQSLGFVLTMPFLIMIVMFIVQVSQLMIGIVVVNYAAFASARSAAVWIPALVQQPSGLQLENELPLDAAANIPVLLSGNHPQLLGSYKYQQIWKTAILGCLPICPSRETGAATPPFLSQTASSLTDVYTAMVPSAGNNAAIPARLQKKLAYAFANTTVKFLFIDKDSIDGPTYNPVEPVVDLDGSLATLWQPNEVGWQDPLQITVTHQYALLPGPGRLLARHLVPANGTSDTVSSRINEEDGTYKIAITGSITITNEGFKSLAPYLQQGN